MNTPVSFPIAKHLKEKGFNNLCKHLWHSKGSECIKMINKNSENFGFSAPTIAEVVMWLYEKYGIWIYIKQGYKWEWYIETVANLPELKYYDGFEDSPTEAYEVAIEYCLTNLI